MAISIPKVWTRKEGVTVAAGATNVIDSIPKNKVRSLEYDIDFRNNDDTLVKSLKLYVCKMDSDTMDTAFAVIGSSLNMAVQTQLNGTDIELEVTNNELFDVTINLARAII